jgi:ABC-2 type transport system ATP-binding protein
MENAIVIDGLKKEYGKRAAVKAISLNVEQGTLFSLLGVNGAGKTTTIKMLTGLTKPTSGEAYVMGRSINTELAKVKKLVSVSPQDTAVAPNLTVRENLEFIAGIYGMDRKYAREKTDELVREFSMEEVEKSKAKTLSGGWQRRLSIAMALITEPKILFLDEPTLGLDVIARRELWQIINSVKKNVTIVLTTHYMEEAEKLSDKVAVMVKGEVKAVGTVSELLQRTGKQNLEEAFVSIVGVE